MRDSNKLAETTALHEAGHAVAHEWLASVMWRDLTFGRVAGIEHVCSRDEADPTVIAYCAGYAALMAAGFIESEAARGADDDFARARHLIEYWHLDGDLRHFKQRAVELMSEPANIAAVQLVAERLMRGKEIDEDVLDNLVALSDGDINHNLETALR